MQKIKRELGQIAEDIHKFRVKNTQIMTFISEHNKKTHKSSVKVVNPNEFKMFDVK